MPETLTLIHQFNRYSHIALGIVGLVLFWFPVFASKGGKLHRITGKAFACIALWVSFTGIVASIWAFLFPVSFLYSLSSVEVKGDSLPYYVEMIRFLFSLLAFLSIATLSGVILGVASVRCKTHYVGLRTVWVVGPLLATSLIAGLLTIFGIWNLWLSNQEQHPLFDGQAQKYWISVALGLLGVFNTCADLRYVLRTNHHRMDWFCKHMECMLGTGIAFYTAFLVFGARTLYEKLGIDLHDAWHVLPWVLPAALGLPLISWQVKKYRRKFGQVPSITLPVESPLG
jgi:hypothetical protein